MQKKWNHLEDDITGETSGETRGAHIRRSDDRTSEALHTHWLSHCCLISSLIELFKSCPKIQRKCKTCSKRRQKRHNSQTSVILLIRSHITRETLAMNNEVLLYIKLIQPFILFLSQLILSFGSTIKKWIKYFFSTDFFYFLVRYLFCGKISLILYVCHKNCMIFAEQICRFEKCLRWTQIAIAMCNTTQLSNPTDTEPSVGRSQTQLLIGTDISSEQRPFGNKSNSHWLINWPSRARKF